MEMTLEKEFKLFILKKMMIKYYTDLQDTNTVCIPSFLRDDTPDRLADKEIYALLDKDKTEQKINHLYKLACEIL